MKTFRLVAMIMALTALPVEGQLELSAGMNLSDLTGSLGGSDLENLGNRAGKAFGIDLVLPMGGLGLNLGVGWTQKGVQDFLTDPGTAQEVAALLDLQYIEIPLHLRVPVVSTGPVSLNLVLGPTFGFQIGCEVASDLSAAQKCADLTNGPDLKETDIGATAGLGLSFGLGGIVYAGFDVRVTTGLTSISNISANSLRNRTVTATTHIGFGIF
jgi:hypothetical protein